MSSKMLMLVAALFAVSLACEIPPSFDCGLAYRGGTPLGNKKCVRVDSKPVTTDIYCQYQELRRAAADAGITLKINSGFRTMAEQEYFWGLYQSGRGNLAAKPGFSNHQNGIALDIDMTSDTTYRWLSRNAQRFGFIRAVASEIWHWEYHLGQRCNSIVSYSCSNGAPVNGGVDNTITNDPSKDNTNGHNYDSNTGVGSPCTVQGVRGICQDRATCRGTTHAGFCPGTSAIQCCVAVKISTPDAPVVPDTTVSCAANGKKGSCVDVSSCRGTTVSGLCPGGSNIKCCISN